jgi:hypothetical protein
VASRRPATDPAAAESGAAVFLAVLLAAALTVVAGLLMPTVAPRSARRRTTPARPGPLAPEETHTAATAITCTANLDTRTDDTVSRTRANTEPDLDAVKLRPGRPRR